MVIDAWRDASGPTRPSMRGDWGVVDDRVLQSMNYFLDNAAGYDFVVVDGSTANKGHGTECRAGDRCGRSSFCCHQKAWGMLESIASVLAMTWWWCRCNPALRQRLMQQISGLRGHVGKGPVRGRTPSIRNARSG